MAARTKLFGNIVTSLIKRIFQNFFTGFSGFRLIKSNISGFTLTEIIVVMGILGIIATTAIIMINPQTQFNKANDGVRKSDMVKLQSALELYRGDNTYYPPTLTLLTSGTPKYLETQPVDPRTKATYAANYQALPTGCNNTTTFCTSYQLWACLDYADPAADVTTRSNCTSPYVKSYTVRNP